VRDVAEVIEDFEGKILEALEFKYGSYPDEAREWLPELSPVTRIDIAQFYDLYLKQDYYPPDRLPTLAYQLIDIKLQLFFIVELDIGLYNHLIYDAGFARESISDFPYVMLRKLSLDQNLIMKSRILWERIMNLVYFLETGKSLEMKGRSKKTRFFEYIPETKWAFLGEYRHYIDSFDDKLRTPEAHKGSVIRKWFQADATTPDENISGLTNIVMNVFWSGLLQIIQGNAVRSRFWFTGMDGNQ